jgi:hypothetical protein
VSQKVLSALDLGAQRMSNVATPTTSTDVATRAYVDASSLGRFRGGWRSDNIPTDGLGGYVLYDLVTYNGTTYRANSTPTAGTAPNNDTHWDVIAAAGISGTNGTNGVSFTYQSGGWSSLNSYSIGMFVTYLNNLYYCNGNISNPATPPNAGDPGWELAMTGSAAGVAIGQVPALAIRSGAYLFQQCSSSANSSGINVNSAYAVPLFIPKATTADRIGLHINVAGSTGALYRLGIYNDNGSWWPGSLLVDGGTIPATAVAYTENTISATIGAAGLFWLVAKCEGVFTNARGSVGPSFGVNPIVGTNGTDLAAGYFAALGSGGLPSNWPAWASAGSGVVNTPARVTIRVTG